MNFSGSIDYKRTSINLDNHGLQDVKPIIINNEGQGIKLKRQYIIASGARSKKRKSEIGRFTYKKYRSWNNKGTSIFYIADGFIYHKYSENRNGRKAYLQCSNKECQSNAMIDKDEKDDQLYMHEVHNHPRPTKDVQRVEFLEVVYRVVREGCYSTIKSYKTGLERKPEAKPYVEFENLVSILYRIINQEKRNVLEANTNISKFVQFMKERPEKFNKIYRESVVDKDKKTCSIIFADENILNEISRLKVELLIDCSYKIKFKTGKNILLTISVNYNYHKYPCFYALMNTFTKDELTKILTLFRDKYGPNPKNLLKILSGCNGELLNTVIEVYGCELVTCSLFHYILSIFERLNNQTNLSDFEAHPVRMELFTYLCAIPMLPPNLIENALQFLEDKSKQHNQEKIFEDLFSYIKDYFIKEVGPNFLSNYRLQSCMNISYLYQIINSFLSTELEHDYVEFTDKLIALQEYLSSLNQESGINNFEKNSKENKNILKDLWESDKIQLNEFFKRSLPVTRSMIDLLLTWGCKPERMLDELLIFNDLFSNNCIKVEQE